MWDFLSYTPIEIHYALQAFYEHEMEQSKGEWERFRTLIYYSYLFVPSKKRKVTYDTFKRDYLKFQFDEESKEPSEVITHEQFMKMQEVIKKLKGES